ncbi:cell division cycle protein 123 like protein [Quercus suber]|uniref:Cell division cycle protein 123 like protein n=1 Tax=Quercus suber TaxID=58331 RepID=A0AAW0LYQ7_QUESU
MENPLFRMGSNLVGTSQHDVTTFYQVLLEKKSNIEWLMRQFYEDHVRLKFESGNYTFDVYVTKDERIKVLDFNPWGAFSLPLLFNWEELRVEH